MTCEMVTNLWVYGRSSWISLWQLWFIGMAERNVDEKGFGCGHFSKATLSSVAADLSFYILVAAVSSMSSGSLANFLFNENSTHELLPQKFDLTCFPVLPERPSEPNKGESLVDIDTPPIMTLEKPSMLYNRRFDEFAAWLHPTDCTVLRCGDCPIGYKSTKAVSSSWPNITQRLFFPHKLS